MKSTHDYLNSPSGAGSVPQGLKPRILCARYGTTKVVPFRGMFYAAGLMLAVALFVLFSAAGIAHAASGDAPRSFSLSTTRTFAPGESVKIQLLARNVPELEFRVYKVRDAEKFFSGLNDAHSFGVKPHSGFAVTRTSSLAQS